MEDKEMDSIIKDHDARLTNLERSTSELHMKVDGLKGDVSAIEKTVVDEGREQRNLLNRLLDHTLGMKETKQQDKTKITLALIGIIGGGGGVLSIIYNLVTYFN